MSFKRKQAKGFTLIELMFVVAIIGILAAIAIPNFLKYQLRAKFGELPTNVNAIFKAEESLRQSERSITIANTTTTGQYVSTGKLPATCTAGTAKNVWANTDMATASNIDWVVEGATYGCYEALASQGGAAFTAAAESDIDGDGTPACVAIFQPKIVGTTITDPTAASNVCSGNNTPGSPYSTTRRFPNENTF